MPQGQDRYNRHNSNKSNCADIQTPILQNLKFRIAYIRDFQEYIMLRLRLADGLRFDELRNRNITLDDAFMKKCELLQKNGLATIDNNSIKLTRKGLLVQNQVLGFLM